MKKWKANYHKNTRVIRVTLGQYGLLKQLADKYGYSMAEALDRILRDKAQQEQIKVSASQMPMPMIATMAMPVIVTNGYIKARAKAVIATNGNIITKSKGGIING